MQGKGLIREERGFHDGVVYKCLLFKFNSKGFGYSKVTCFKGGVCVMLVIQDASFLTHNFVI